MGHDVGRWSGARAPTPLREHGMATLAVLTVGIPRGRQWWKPIPGLGPASARRIEAFFAAYPMLTGRARALIAISPARSSVPWESLRLPHEVDGSSGAFRAPRHTGTLDANNDYAAVQAWLSLHESTATQRAYRKEAERLILWAIVERDRALSSLTTEDAIAYRSFMRRPTPRERWVGPVRARSSPEWRPFSRGLSAQAMRPTPAQDPPLTLVQAPRRRPDRRARLSSRLRISSWSAPAPLTAPRTRPPQSARLPRPCDQARWPCGESAALSGLVQLANLEQATQRMGQTRPAMMRIRFGRYLRPPMSPWFRSGLGAS